MKNPAVAVDDKLPAPQRAALAADRCLLAKQYAQAATAYAELLRDGQLPLALRVDAWAGLLAADPAQAIAREGGWLTGALATLPAGKTRTDLAGYAAKQVWASMQRHAGSYRGNATDPTPATGVDITVFADWIHPTADLLEKLMGLCEASARPAYTQDKRSIYHIAAVALALDHRPRRAVELLLKGTHDQCLDISERNADGKVISTASQLRTKRTRRAGLPAIRRRHPRRPHGRLRCRRAAAAALRRHAGGVRSG